MAKIKEVKEIALAILVIGKAQVRTRETAKEIGELAESIDKVGLLEPIVVCPAEEAGKYEIITGQRRFLAHQELKRPTILAAILDERVDETTAKVLSITENLIRRDLNSRDLIDACTALYKKYGSIKAVVEETGLPHSKVSTYVKYDRLEEPLRELVDKGEVEIKTALRAQDAVATSGHFDASEAIKLAKEMSCMSGAQQQKVSEEVARSPDVPVDEAIENAKTGGKITQVIVTLGAAAHSGLSSYSKEEGTSLDDAARSLIEEGLSSKGFLEGQ